MVRDIEDEIRDEKNPRPLDEDDIALLKTYVSRPLFRTLNLVGVSDFYSSDSSENSDPV